MSESNSRGVSPRPARKQFGKSRRTRVGRRPVKVRQMWETTPSCPAAIFRDPVNPAR